jgi:hypothetical protein
MCPCPPGPSSGSLQFVESVVPRLFCVRGIFLCEPAASVQKADSRMSYTAEQCYDKARDCALKALQVKDAEAKAAFSELVRQRQELAQQKEDMEWNRLK